MMLFHEDQKWGFSPVRLTIEEMEKMSAQTQYIEENWELICAINRHQPERSKREDFPIEGVDFNIHYPTMERCGALNSRETD